MELFRYTDCHRTINMLVVFVLCFLISDTLSQGDDQDILSYNIEEESVIGTEVGSVFMDAGLDDNPEIAENGYLTFADTNSEISSLFLLTEGRILTVRRRLDRESLCSGLGDCFVNVDFQLQPQSYFRIIKARVRIIDINDNPPVFTDTIISRSISEAAAIGAKIPIPAAVDPDSPAFGLDHYEINDTSGIFALDQSSTPSRFLIVNDRLDREKRDMYRIHLTAFDKGQPSQFGFTIIEINVVDVNDNVPQFSNDTYYTIIPEDFPLHIPVITVHATDPDAGKNAEIVYNLDPATQESYGEYFTIDSQTGVIKVSNPLDFEVTPTVTLTVTATNADDTSMSSFTNVLINIGDVNDNPPIITVHGITQDNEILKEETTSLQDFVAHVAVSDPDSNDNGKVDCTLSGNEFFLVKMYDTDYVIQNNIPLDRELRSHYDISMTCTDRGNVRQSTVQNIRVVIQDINDNSPVFSKQTYYTTIEENNDIGHTLLSVSATDLDAGLNGTVLYQLQNGVDHLLQIDQSSGIITAKISLDRESISRIEGVILARDQGTPKSLSATVSFRVDIIDQDDNEPTFTSAEYSFWILEGQSAQSFVGQVNASDPDTDVFSQFGYFIEHDGEGTELFSIERSSGKIYTTQILNREEKSLFNFQVRALGNGPTLKSTVATVYVHVTDINDQSPVIEYPNPTNNTVYLSNRVTEGTIISRILASDKDIGVNADLAYFIVSGNEGGYFSVSHDGAVTVDRSLKEFDQRAFGLVIMVSDNGSPPRSTESYLNVVVNQSLSDGSSGLMTHQNLTIVIAIASVSGFLMVILIVAIVILLRCPRMKSATAKKYNYVARILDNKLTNRSQNNSGSHDNPACDVEKADMASMEISNNTNENSKNFAVKRDKHSSTGSSFSYHINIQRRADRDSECSSASSTETDSGRGSHEDVVLDNSSSRIQLDRHKDNTDMSVPDRPSKDLPLINSLQHHTSSGLHPSDTNRMWDSTSTHSSKYHPQLLPYLPHHKPAHSQAREPVPVEPPRPPRASHSAYSWQSSHVSSEVQV